MTDENELSEALKNPIPVLSNRLILEMMKMGKIKIGDYDPAMLGPTNYRLRANKVRFHQYHEDGFAVADGIVSLENGKDRVLHPGDSVVVSPKETILLDEGLIAEFYPASFCIENNLIVTAGRLDAKYHNSLVFGLYNAGSEDFTIKSSTEFLRVSFSWLGQLNMPNYSGFVPGAYIKKIEELRDAEQRIAEVAGQLAQQRAQIERQIEELTKKGA
jgi:deoxycytidine triphosphate deaminase